MDHLLLVKVNESLGELPDVIGCPVLRVAFSFLSLEVFIELTAQSKLENEVYVLVVPKEPVHLEDVGVVQKALDLDLSLQLVFHLTLN